MRKVLLIATTTFRDILRRKVIYIAALLSVLATIFFLSSLTFVEMASEAGETEMEHGVKIQVVSFSFNMWRFIVELLGLFLGATAVSVEIRSRTIIPVLSRPVERWSFLLGKWFGIQAFLGVFLAIGITVGLLLVWHWDVEPSNLLFVAIIEMFVTGLYISGVSLGLSTLMNPVLAGGVTYFLTIVPYLVSDLFYHPLGVVRALASCGYYLSPATTPIDLIGGSLQQGPATPEYALYGAVLLENAGYSVAVFLFGAIVFTYRELRLR